MKRPLVTISSTGVTVRPPPKRSRKKATVVYTFSPEENSKTSEESIQVVTVNTRARSGRFGIRNSTVKLAKEPDPAPDPSDVSAIPTEDPNALDAGEWDDMLGDDLVQAFKRKRKQRNDSVGLITPVLCFKRLTNLQTKMRDWIQHVRQSFLDELIRRNGLGGVETPGPCQICQQIPGTIRCMECSGSVLVCRGCAVHSHQRNPLHRIEVCTCVLSVLPC
jgi:hypothetical protein